MIASDITDALTRKYPSAAILKNDERNPTEIVCETDPASAHPQYSVAVAVIDRSLPHVHKVTTETYEVLKGRLTLVLNGKVILLETGDSAVVTPDTVHWAEGNSTWVSVRSEPGWTAADHIPVRQAT